MNGRVCVVTGASAGLGKALSLALARQGNRVVMLSRNPVRGEAALAEVKAKSGSEQVSLAVCDLSSMDAVRRCASQLLSELPRLEVLVNNAAVYRRVRTVTAEGLEVMLATNHLGPFLLTRLLLERLEQSGPSRILNVTAPSTTPLDVDDLQGERRFSSFSAFGASKMCNLLFTFALARRLEGTGTTVNAVHPGLVRSNILNEAPAPLRWMTRAVASTPEKAAQPLAWLCTAPEAERHNGRFFRGTRPITVPRYAQQVQVQERLWSESEKLVGLHAP